MCHWPRVSPDGIIWSDTIKGSRQRALTLNLIRPLDLISRLQEIELMEKLNDTTRKESNNPFDNIQQHSTTTGDVLQKVNTQAKNGIVGEILY